MYMSGIGRVFKSCYSLVNTITTTKSQCSKFIKSNSGGWEFDPVMQFKFEQVQTLGGHAIHWETLMQTICEAVCETLAWTHIAAISNAHRAPYLPRLYLASCPHCTMPLLPPPALPSHLAPQLLCRCLSYEHYGIPAGAPKACGMGKLAGTPSDDLNFGA